MINFNIDEQVRIISKGSDEIISIEELKDKLLRAKEENRQLVVKLGLDPTAPDIHLGHSVVLRKARQFQDLGHKVVIIIGDFTGMIGDPTGKSKTRKALTKEEVLENAETYKKQIFKILKREQTEVRFNSEWLDNMNFAQVIELMSRYTVSRMLEREEFKKRFTSNQPISIHEFMYPLIQGQDSISIKADIELGGTDQRFNILMGRTLQKEFGLEKQIAIFMPIIEGTDGVEKMSKSLGNYIGINESSFEMFSKTMTIPDNMIIKFFELVTDMHPDEIDKIKNKLDTGINPRDIKMQLAREIVELYHGEEEANKAFEEFKAVFQKNEMPDSINEIKIDFIGKQIGINEIIKTIIEAGFAKTNREARRAVEQSSVKINGEKFDKDDTIIINSGDVLQVGKRKFVRLV